MCKVISIEKQIEVRKLFGMLVGLAFVDKDKLDKLPRPKKDGKLIPLPKKK